jgi:hypothetical protein
VEVEHNLLHFKMAYQNKKLEKVMDICSGHYTKTASFIREI